MTGTGSQLRMKIIIPINDSAYNQELQAIADSVAPPDLHVDVGNITQGVSAIQSRCDRMTNAPYVVDAAVAAAQQGYQGVFVSDFDYCGVEEARERVNIPVIGGFRPSAFTAMALGERFSIMTILDSVVDLQRSHTRLFGIEPNFASITPIDLPVHELSDKRKVIDKVFECSVTAIERYRCDVIILGCTGFMGIADLVTERLSRHYGFNVPVIDPNKTAILELYTLMKTQRYQSRLTYSFVS